MTHEFIELNLKKVNAYKKNICWGDVPANYHLLAGSLGELDGILTHGFNNAYTELLNKKNWNLKLLQGEKCVNGAYTVKRKPQISLKHYYHENEYELHCFPVINGEKIYHQLIKDPDCPFIQWLPSVSQRLFKISHLIQFISYAFNKGDDADMLLLKFAHLKVEHLITHLKESFEVIDIEGSNIKEFCQQLSIRKKEYDNENHSSNNDFQNSFLGDKQ